MGNYMSEIYRWTICLCVVIMVVAAIAWWRIKR
jgi:hypothetical protein